MVLGYSSPRELIHKHNTFMKFRKSNTDTMLVSNIQSIFKFHKVSQNVLSQHCFFPKPHSNLGSHIVFRCHASSTCFNLNLSFSLSSSFITLMVWWAQVSGGIQQTRSLGSPSYTGCFFYGCSCCAWYHHHQPLCLSTLFLTTVKFLPLLKGPNKGLPPPWIPCPLLIISFLLLLELHP